MSLDRKVARKLRLMKSPVFEALAWLLALFVPHRRGFGKFRDKGAGGSQTGELILPSRAIDNAQDLPREEPKRPPTVDLQDGLAPEPFFSGGVWAIESIEQTPELMLDSWQCFEVKLARLPYRTRHLAGSNARHWHGQVSSAIVVMDPATRKCTTKSGRVYELGERNGLVGDGEYTWHRWLHINQASDIVDVTNEIKKMLAEHP